MQKNGKKREREKERENECTSHPSSTPMSKQVLYKPSHMTSDSPPYLMERHKAVHKFEKRQNLEAKQSTTVPVGSA